MDQDQKTDQVQNESTQKSVDMDAITKAIEGRLSEKYTQTISKMETELSELRKFKESAANKANTPEEFEKRLKELNAAHENQLKLNEDAKRKAEEELKAERLKLDSYRVFIESGVVEKRIPMVQTLFRDMIGRDATGQLILLDERGEAKTDPNTGLAMPFKKYFSDVWLKDNPDFKSASTTSGTGTSRQTLATPEDVEAQLKALMRQLADKTISQTEYDEKSKALRNILYEQVKSK